MAQAHSPHHAKRAGHGSWVPVLRRVKYLQAPPVSAAGEWFRQHPHLVFDLFLKNQNTSICSWYFLSSIRTANPQKAIVIFNSGSEPHWFGKTAEKPPKSANQTLDPGLTTTPGWIWCNSFSNSFNAMNSAEISGGSQCEINCKRIAAS